MTDRDRHDPAEVLAQPASRPLHRRRDVGHLCGRVLLIGDYDAARIARAQLRVAGDPVHLRPGGETEASLILDRVDRELEAGGTRVDYQDRLSHPLTVPS